MHQKTRFHLLPRWPKPDIGRALQFGKPSLLSDPTATAPVVVYGGDNLMGIIDRSMSLIA
jgi:hypothetical protein